MGAKKHITKKRMPTHRLLIGVFVVAILGLLIYINAIRRQTDDRYTSEFYVTSEEMMQQNRVSRQRLDTLLATFDYLGGSVVGTSKIDACYQMYSKSAGFIVGESETCYYRTKIVIAYKSDLESTKDITRTLARQLGYTFPGTPGHDFTEYSGETCTEIAADYDDIRYVQPSVKLYDAATPYYEQFCSKTSGNEQYETHNQVSGTSQQILSEQTFDEAQAYKQAIAGGAKSIVIIILHLRYG